MLTLSYAITGTTLLIVLSCVANWTLGPAIVLAWAAIVGVLAAAWVRFTDPDAAASRSSLGPVLIAGIATGVAAMLTALVAVAHWSVWMEIPVSLVSAWVAQSFGTGASAGVKCFICKRPLAGGGAFVCPRCHQQICSQPGCWSARHFRCRYCEEREVVLFPLSEQWWVPRVGARVTKGECSSCYKEAHEADLRACGRCNWPMCKRCWDVRNGQCAHCEWLLPNMPAELYRFVRDPQDRVRDGAAGRRR